MRGPRVMVVMGGPSTEHAVSLASGQMVLKALATKPTYSTAALVITREGHWEKLEAGPQGADLTHLPQGALSPGEARQAVLDGARHLAACDVAFLALHGRFGEDGTLQGFLETLGVPYTGSGPLASSMAMNKQIAKRWFSGQGLLVAPDLSVEAAWPTAKVLRLVDERLGWPVVVKPVVGGSSIGITLVDGSEGLAPALEAARAADQAVFIESAVTGREVTCAVVEDASGGPEAMPVIEIVPRGSRFFDFRAKYEDEAADEVCPAPLTDAEREAVQTAAVRAHLALGCRGFSRTDMILTSRGPVVLELNTIPGMTPNSLLPKAARAAGVSFPDLVERFIQTALATGS